METINNLSWKATPSAEWIKVNPTAGSGDKTIEVTVEDSDVHSTDLAGTITVECTSCELLSGEQIIKTIDVCRCSCDCHDNVSTKQKLMSIGEEGVKKGTVVATYNITKRCRESAISAILTNDKSPNDRINLLVSDKEITLPVDIQPNDKQSKITYNVDIIFDGEQCTSYTFDQAALECNCGVSLNDFRWEIQSPIPQKGLPGGTVIFSFINKQFCPITESTIKAKLTYSDSSVAGRVATKNLVIENGTGEYEGRVIGRFNQLKLDENIEPEDRMITVTVSYTGNTSVQDECKQNYFNQIGCNCDTALIRTSFNVCISTFGVLPGEEIGSFSMNPDTNCPVGNIYARLYDEDGKEYPLLCNTTSPTSRQGKIWLSENSDPISINDEKIERTFHLLVDYGNIKNCVDEDIIQRGIDCDCENVRFSFSHYYPDGFPQSGMEIGDIIGEYEFINAEEGKCKNCSDCFKIICERINDDGTTTIISVKLENNLLKLNEDIPENDDIVTVTFRFTPMYNISQIEDECGKTAEADWRECTPSYKEQLGKKCSCDNVQIEQIKVDGKDITFPRTGTRGQYVEIAVGDIGLYTSPPDHKFLKSCGSLSGYSESKLLGDYESEENKVRTIPLDEDKNPVEVPDENTHFYSFQVIVNDSAEGNMKVGTNVYYFDSDGNVPEQPCPDKFAYVYIDVNACDCIIERGETMLIPCDGSPINKTSDLLKLTKVHSGITVNASLIEKEGVTTVITDLETKITYDNNIPSPRNKIVTVVGKVPGNGTKKRIAGVIKISASCPNWACDLTDDEGNDISEYEIWQEKCDACDCDYITGTIGTSTTKRLQITSSEVTLPYKYNYYENYYKVEIARFNGMTNCLVVKIDGQEENGYYIKTIDIDGVEEEWYRAKIEKEYLGGIFYYYVKFEISQWIKTETGDTLNIIYGYYSESEGDVSTFNSCTSSTLSVSSDECGCDLLKSEIYNNEIDSHFTNPFYYYYNNMDVNFHIKLGADENYTTAKLFSDYLIDCISLRIKVCDEEIEECLLTEYTYQNDQGEDLFTVTIFNNNEVRIDLVNSEIKIDREYDIYIVPVYVDRYGNVQMCEQLKVYVSQDVCNCDKISNWCNQYTEYGKGNRLIKVNIPKDGSETNGDSPIKGDLQKCIKILLVDPVDGTEHHIGSSPSIASYITIKDTETGDEMFDISVYGRGNYYNQEILPRKDYEAFNVRVKLKPGVTLRKQYELQGYYYYDSVNGDEKCCDFKVVVTQELCSCNQSFEPNFENEYKIEASICNIGDNTAIIAENRGSDCHSVKLYLVCDKTDDGCTCSCDEGECKIKIDDNIYANIDDNKYFFDKKICYPEKYSFVHDMPEVSHGNLQIVFDPLLSVGSRRANFLALWVYEDGKPIAKDESGNIVPDDIENNEISYCGKYFTIIQEYKVDCDCISTKYDESPYTVGKTIYYEVESYIEPGTSEKIYIIYNDVETEILYFLIDRNLYNCLSFSVAPDNDKVFGTNIWLTEAENYDENTYKITLKGTGHISTTQDTQNFGVSIYIKDKNNPSVLFENGGIAFKMELRRYNN